MNVFDFITQDELDDLPEDNEQAFSIFVRHAQRRLREATEHLDGRDENEWREIREARYGFTNVILAAAKRLHIDTFKDIDVPRISKFDDDDYRQLIADLDHYMTQLAIDTSFRSRRDSTLIPANSKDRIRSHLHHLKQAISDANLTDAKKDTLLKKVAEFEAALEKNRLNLMAVARVTIEILSVPGALWSSYEVVHKLVWNINQTVAEAKVEDDERRKLPAVPKPFALIPPRAAETEPRKGGFSRELDDDIPF